MKYCLFFIMTMTSLWSAGTPPLSWSSSSLLYSTSGYDGSFPQISADPISGTATAAWVAQGTDASIVYSANFHGGSWGSPEEIFSSSHLQVSLGLGVDLKGNHLAVWDAQDDSTTCLRSSINEGSGWTTAMTVQDLGEISISRAVELTARQGGGFLLSWQNLDSNLQGVSYLLGTFSSPFFITSQELEAIQVSLSRGKAIFATIEGLFEATIDPGDSSSEFTSLITFPRSIVPASLNLHVNSDYTKTAYVFQDRVTRFLICAITIGTKKSYTTISIPNQTVESASIALSPVDSLPAVVWQLSDGTIQAAHFDGHRWTNRVTLSSAGSSPMVGYNATNNHAVVVWADSVAGGISNTVKTAEFDRFSWTSPVSISPGGFSVQNPQIQINSSGEAFVIWSRIPTSGANVVIEAAYGSKGS